MDPLEELTVELDDRVRLMGVAHPLAKERCVGEQPLPVESRECLDCGVERLARDEASGAESETVLLGDALQPSALGRCENRVSKRGA